MPTQRNIKCENISTQISFYPKKYKMHTQKNTKCAYKSLRDNFKQITKSYCNETLDINRALMETIRSHVHAREQEIKAW